MARKPRKATRQPKAKPKPKDQPKAAASAGRPSVYTPAFVGQVEMLCKLGATDEELASFFHVSVRTLYRWKAKYPDFCQAIKSAGESADERVERSLYHRAVGYTYDAVKIMQVQGQVIEHAYKEHVPPDTTAAIFWLKNRRGAAWKDVRKHEVGQPGDFDTMSDDELEHIARAGGGRIVAPPAGSSKLN